VQRQARASPALQRHRHVDHLRFASRRDLVAARA
jgi:hypothetical protein